MRSQGLVMGNHFHFPPSIFWATPVTFLTTDASTLQMVLWLTWLKCSAIHHFGSLGVDGTLLPDWDPTTTFSDVHFLRVGTNDYVNDIGSAAVESCEVHNSVCVVDVGCSSGKCTSGSLAWEGSNLLLLLVLGEGAMDQNVLKVSILLINAHGQISFVQGLSVRMLYLLGFLVLCTIGENHTSSLIPPQMFGFLNVVGHSDSWCLLPSFGWLLLLH